jgi:hypothetical protein
MRKVKFAQQTFHDKLTMILTEFPKLEVHIAIVYIKKCFYLVQDSCNLTILLVNNCWCLSLCFGQHNVNKVLKNKITSHES